MKKYNKLNIGKYIKELVIRNECIIVPGFGGFETHYKPAYFDKSAGRLNPPSKKIVFKPEYQIDGGVLVNYVAVKEKCDVTEAKDMVDEYVKEISSQINSSGFYVIEGFGKLIRQETGIIAFMSLEEENYLIDSYGLSDIKIADTEINEEIVQPVEEPSSISKPTVSKKPVFILAATTLFILVLVLLSVKFGFDEKIKAVFGGTTSKKHKTEPKIVFGHRPSPAFRDSVTVKLKEKLDEKTEKQRALFYKEPEKKPEIKPQIHNTPEIKQADEFGEEKRYIIVAGSFMKQSLALELQNSLITHGYHPEIIKTDNGLYRVALESLDDIDLAIQQLERYKKKLNDNLWILRI